MDAASSTASSSALCTPVAGGGACAPPGDVGVSVGASAELAARLATRRRLRSMPSEHWLRRRGHWLRARCLPNTGCAGEDTAAGEITAAWQSRGETTPGGRGSTENGRRPPADAGGRGRRLRGGETRGTTDDQGGEGQRYYDGRGKRRSIYTTVPAAAVGVYTRPCPTLPGSGFCGRGSPRREPSYTSIIPNPTTHYPYNAPLPRIVFVCSTFRVCVPEYPPLGRPSS